MAGLMEDQQAKPLTLRKAALFCLPFLAVISLLTLARYSAYPYYQTIQHQKMLMAQEQRDREVQFIQAWMKGLDEESDLPPPASDGKAPPIATNAEGLEDILNPNDDPVAYLDGIKAQLDMQDELDRQVSEIKRQRAQADEARKQAALGVPLQQVQHKPLKLLNQLRAATAPYEDVAGDLQVKRPERMVEASHEVEMKTSGAQTGPDGRSLPAYSTTLEEPLSSRKFQRKLLARASAQQGPFQRLLFPRLAKESRIVRRLPYVAAPITTQPESASSAIQAVIYVQVASSPEHVKNLDFLMRYRMTEDLQIKIYLILQNEQVRAHFWQCMHMLIT